MRLNGARVVAGLLCLLGATVLHAQQAPVSSTVTTVPRLVRVTSAFVPANGLPPGPVETVTLAIYAEATGGTPLWQETQTVAVDGDGRYSLLLGATLPEGLPLELFASGEARWLGRRFERPGEREQARVLLASVPYALKASDADTLGGKPPSAYLLAPASDGATSATAKPLASTAANATSTRSTTAASAAGIVNPGIVNQVAKYVSDSDLGPSAIYVKNGFVGLNTTTPFDILHARFTSTNGGLAGYAVQNLGNTAMSYSGMLFYDQNDALGTFQGFNNSTHEYRLNNVAAGGSINFLIGSSSKFQVRADGDVDISGNIRKGGVPFLHNFGTENTFLGQNAGNFTMTSFENTASGAYALQENATGCCNTASGAYALYGNTTGRQNTAVGDHALSGNETGSYNTASGMIALASNTTGESNTANGYVALSNNRTGLENTAIGAYALPYNTTGSDNVAVGVRAGFNVGTGSNNIYLGAGVFGIEGESNTMYLGVPGTQTKTVIAGIRGTTTAVADAVPVMIDSAGQLGTVSSSRRFKEDVRDMGDASHSIFALRPVTFRYSQAYANGVKPLQYGLVAEEVAKAFPALAVFNADGNVDTVHYETLSVLLLNEVQLQQQRIEALERRLEALLARPREY